MSAVAPPRSCPRCKQLFKGDGCPRCTRARDQARGTAQQRGYTSQWAEFSRRWLRQFPWCGMRVDGRIHVEHSRCAQMGLRIRATVTDHIVSLRSGGEHLSERNSQSLCTSCNNAKGKSES